MLEGGDDDVGLVELAMVEDLFPCKGRQKAKRSGTTHCGLGKLVDMQRLWEWRHLILYRVHVGCNVLCAIGFRIAMRGARYCGVSGLDIDLWEFGPSSWMYLVNL